MADKPTPRFVKTKAEMARLLDISRVTLDAWLKLSDSPRCRSDGRFPVDEWRAYKARKKMDDSIEETAELKLQKLRNEVAQSEVDLMKAAGELVPLEWSRQLFAHLAISIRNIVQGSELAEHDKLSLTEQIEKINADEYLSQLRSQTFDVVAEEPELGLSNGTGESQAAS